jgi:eukaryotic-like serine/threonine-protein kinase
MAISPSTREPAPRIKALLKARQKLGKYVIKRRLANGPLAAVYEALDTIQDVRVALKIPQPGATDEFFLQDFKREARLAAKLEHENILPVRDASYIDGHFVIVMPLGIGSLADRMKSRLPTKTILSFTEQALAAVAHAHQAKIIHCDIKPGNFVVFPGDCIKLTDFAFSKVAQRSVRASGSGTVGYIAPEQAVGRPMFQSDVFSLGLLIYELLSGYVSEWPYDWPPPGIDRVKRKLTPEQVAWLRKALEVKPERRYRNAVVMLEEFRRLKRRRPTRKRGRHKPVNDDPNAWQDVLFRQFQRKYRKVLDTRHHCEYCSGPISELMQSCPWCGSKVRPAKYDSSFPAQCPRCAHGSKLDWKYCAWCYGPAFEVETNRKFHDKRYTQRCASRTCRGPLMPFMRYCPWCKTKVKRPWKLPGSRSYCPSCGWGVDTHYWHHCPWCTKALEQ